MAAMPQSQARWEPARSAPASIALDRDPGQPPAAGHGRWREGDAPSARAASLASSAALLYAPDDAAYPARWRAGGPYVIPYVIPYALGCVPLALLAERIRAGQSPSWGQSAANTAADWPPSGGVERPGRVVRFARLIGRRVRVFAVRSLQVNGW